MYLSLLILGAPVGKERPRVTRNGKHTYTPPKTKNYATMIKTLYVRSHGTLMAFPPKQKIYMAMMVYFKNDVRPDLNNVERLITDALEGLSYKNDKVVACSYKDYDYDKEKPRVELLMSDKLINKADFEMYYADTE